jgi:hypothetical protein
MTETDHIRSDGVGHVRREASKQRPHDVIKVFASEVSNARWMCVRLMRLFMY